MKIQANKEKNFPQGFKLGDLVCWVDDADKNNFSYCGIVVEPYSFKSAPFGTQFNASEYLWIVWNDGSKSRHLSYHLSVIAEVETK
tara:strand:- start:27 stop:284 length:258 start_codon:yes stop_codon:yes gene_type:complete